jgi:hypothetical protein
MRLPRWPKAAKLMADAKQEVLALCGFPAAH